MGRTGFVKKLARHLFGYPYGLHPTFLELLALLLSVYLIGEELAPIFGEMRLDLLADHLTAILLIELHADSIDARLVILIGIACPTRQYADDLGL